MFVELSILAIIALLMALIVRCSGEIFPSGVAGDTYKKAVESAIEKLRTDHDSLLAADVSDVPQLST